MHNCGIYAIRNTINGDEYVGQSSRINRRLYEHKYYLSHNKHANIHLQRAYNLYSETAFEFDVLLYCDPEFLTYYEQAIVDKTKPRYNIHVECVNSSKGVKFNKEIKEKLSRIQSTRDNSRIFTMEVREKIRKYRTGKRMNECTRKKLKEYFTINPSHYERTQEYKKQMHEKTIGIKKTEAHKCALSINKKEYYLNQRKLGIISQPIDALVATHVNHVLYYFRSLSLA